MAAQHQLTGAANMYYKERLSFVATQRAPLVGVVSMVLADQNNQWTTLTLACGHSIDCVSHFSYKIGELQRL
jgi:hypothetical protein